MKTIQINNKNIPLVAVDENLDKLRDKIAFPQKLAKANKILKTAKLPESKHFA